MTRFADIGVFHSDTMDFSEYHPLEHSLAVCHDRIKHLRLWWSYFGQEQVEQALFGKIARITCRMNIHWWLPSYDLESSLTGSLCNWCPAWRP